ncbi:MAG: hypothetical protein ACLQMF_20185 [Rectinemataceae bacterium]
MSSITLWNKGKRTWRGLDLLAGGKGDLPPGQSLEVDEVLGLRLINSYPKDLASTKTVAPSAVELARQEQSLRDRKKALDEREKALDERESIFKAREAEAETPHRGPGRPPKAPHGAEAAL